MYYAIPNAQLIPVTRQKLKIEGFRAKYFLSKII